MVRMMAVVVLLEMVIMKLMTMIIIPRIVMTMRMEATVLKIMFYMYDEDGQ